MARRNKNDILGALGKGMQDAASTVAKGTQGAAGVVAKGAKDAAGVVVKEGTKAVKKGAAAVGDAAQRAVDAVKNQQVITPEQMQGLLDAAYSQSLDGIPNVSEPVEDMAADYARRHATPEEAAVDLINYQLIKCTTSGALSGLAGVLALPVALASIPANIAGVIYVQMRMVAALAVLGGYDVHEDQVQTAVYLCMAGGAAADVLKDVGVQVGNKVAVNALKKLPGSVLTAINKKVGFRLATKFGETGIVNLGKLVPVVGAVIGGGFDFATTRVIATTAYNQFIGTDAKAVEARIVDEAEAEVLAEGSTDAAPVADLGIEVGGVALVLPGAYQRLDAMPGDAPGSVALGMEAEGARCFLMAEPIEATDAMPFEDDAPVIDGIHEALADDQGLVEVGHGTTRDGMPYVYSVVKTAQEPSGVQYSLTLHVSGGEGIASFQGFYDETGVTGMRDTVIFDRYRARGSKGSWRADPYDPERTEGNLMNLSERPEYDPAFPGHPLTLARAFVAFLAENN